MSPGLPRAVEGQALQAQLDKERQLDAAAAQTLSKKAETWSGRLASQASGPSIGSTAVLTLGEDGVQRPCCTHVRPLQLRYVWHILASEPCTTLDGSQPARGPAMLRLLCALSLPCHNREEDNTMKTQAGLKSRCLLQADSYST